MNKYIKVLDDVICLSDIRSVSTMYKYRSAYHKQEWNKLVVTYNNGAKEEYATLNYELAKKDFENLKQTLLDMNYILETSNHETPFEADESDKPIDSIKKEAYREFVDELKNYAFTNASEDGEGVVEVEDIENVLRELGVDKE